MFLLRRALGLVSTPPAPRRGAHGTPPPARSLPLADIGDEPDLTTEEAPRPPTR
ncbi:MAG: hypothetical protein ACI8PZ_002249 [Myxococcota bacterium]|jgi:hypothetical protein